MRERRSRCVLPNAALCARGEEPPPPPPAPPLPPRQTLWANAGCHQFHLPAGKPAPQVFDGVITLAFQSLAPVLARIETRDQVLDETCFSYAVDSSGNIAVTDPWGTQFRLVADPDSTTRDPRGSQPGPSSHALAMPDLTVHVPLTANLAG